jgi:hypothetical protein
LTFTLGVKVLVALISALVAGIVISALILSYYEGGITEQQMPSPTDNFENSSLLVGLEDPINLTNNPRDSVYGQVAAWNNSVYVVWQDSMPAGGRNYDIFISKSENKGDTFASPINLSNNEGFSEHPQIASHSNNVYVVWADNTSENKEVMFARSVDDGATFEEPQNLSNNPSDSFNQEIAALGNYVYVVWLDEENDGHSILLKGSTDGGATFGRAVEISRNANDLTLPKVAASGDKVYLTWNVLDDDLGDSLFFVKSSEDGNALGNITKLNRESDVGEAQIVAYGNAVSVLSGGPYSFEDTGLFLTKNLDSGDSSSGPVEINANGRFANPMNVEGAAHDDAGQQVLYVAGQVLVSGNEEILLLQMSGNDSKVTALANLSRNSGISECPSIAIAGGNVYVVWEDLTPGNHEILLARGTLA